MNNITLDTSTNTYVTANAQTSSNTSEETAATATASTDAAAVYEKSTTSSTSSTNQIYSRESIISKLKADEESRAASMQTLVENLLNQQKSVYDISSLSGLAQKFKLASTAASAEDIANAQQSISEDGYWGVEQTSNRLVSMAIALSGGDTDKADELMAAITKGFEKATSAWGEELPQICQDTYDATLQKMEDWKNGLTTAEDYASYLS